MSDLRPIRDDVRRLGRVPEVDPQVLEARRVWREAVGEQVAANSLPVTAFGRHVGRALRELRLGQRADAAGAADALAAGGADGSAAGPAAVRGGRRGRPGNGRVSRSSRRPRSSPATISEHGRGSWRPTSATPICGGPRSGRSRPAWHAIRNALVTVLVGAPAGRSGKLRVAGFPLFQAGFCCQSRAMTPKTSLFWKGLRRFAAGPACTSARPAFAASTISSTRWSTTASTRRCRATAITSS